MTINLRCDNGTALRNVVCLWSAASLPGAFRRLYRSLTKGNADTRSVPRRHLVKRRSGVRLPSPALPRLRDHGFVLHEERRDGASGRYEQSHYVLDPSACIERFTTSPPPCPKPGHGHTGHREPGRKEQEAAARDSGAAGLWSRWPVGLCRRHVLDGSVQLQGAASVAGGRASVRRRPSSPARSLRTIRPGVSMSLHRGVLPPSMLGRGLPLQADHYPGSPRARRARDATRLNWGGDRDAPAPV